MNILLAIIFVSFPFLVYGKWEHDVVRGLTLQPPEYVADFACDGWPEEFHNLACKIDEFKNSRTETGYSRNLVDLFLSNIVVFINNMRGHPSEKTKILEMLDAAFLANEEPMRAYLMAKIYFDSVFATEELGSHRFGESVGCFLAFLKEKFFFDIVGEDNFIFSDFRKIHNLFLWSRENIKKRFSDSVTHSFYSKWTNENLSVYLSVWVNSNHTRQRNCRKWIEANNLESIISISYYNLVTVKDSSALIEHLGLVSAPPAALHYPTCVLRTICEVVIGWVHSVLSYLYLLVSSSE